MGCHVPTFPPHKPNPEGIAGKEHPSDSSRQPPSFSWCTAVRSAPLPSQQLDKKVTHKTQGGSLTSRDTGWRVLPNVPITHGLKLPFQSHELPPGIQVFTWGASCPPTTAWRKVLTSVEQREKTGASHILGVQGHVCGSAQTPATCSHLSICPPTHLPIHPTDIHQAPGATPGAAYTEGNGPRHQLS